MFSYSGAKSEAKMVKLFCFLVQVCSDLNLNAEVVASWLEFHRTQVASLKYSTYKYSIIYLSNNLTIAYLIHASQIHATRILHIWAQLLI